MSETTITTEITRENAREMIMSTATALSSNGWRKAGYTKVRLLQILQNNDHCRDIFEACMNEAVLIKAFTCASSSNLVDLLQVFFDLGMNVNVQDQRGCTALLNASSNYHEESTQWCLDHDANVDIQDEKGMTALMYAVEADEITEMLLEKNANLDIQNNGGRSALMLASRYGYEETVELLLDHNADTGLTDIDGKTALDLAKTEEIKEVLRNHVNTSYLLK